MGLITVGLLMFRELSSHTPYLYVLACLVPLGSGMALTMSPMSTSIMSAVPARRAGAGSAMNDATRELGAALGVAVLGSVAASRYSSVLEQAVAGLSASARGNARSSLAGALHVAGQLHAGPSRGLIVDAQNAFIDGIHLAVTLGAVLTAAAAVITYRYLPREPAPEASLLAREPH
jgi:hypothetical protein